MPKITTQDEGTGERHDLAGSKGNVKGGGDAGACGHDVEDGLVPCIDGEDASQSRRTGSVKVAPTPTFSTMWAVVAIVRRSRICRR